MMRKRKIRDSVVVITGGSSGIGRASAIEFARKGAVLAVFARGEESLRSLAAQCEQRGGRIFTKVVDVTDEAAVNGFAADVIEKHGRIDTWVNNAAVTLFGRLEATPYADCRRVIETNLFGCIHGARAAIPVFREQGEGVLINIASMVGKSGQPFASMYVTSKFGIVGFSECLRMELMDAPGIHVCTVLPASVDTPLFQHGANFAGRYPKPVEPVYDVYTVADAIVGVAERPRRETVVGSAGRVLPAVRTLAPGLSERLVAGQIEKHHFQDVPAEPHHGNLFEPMEQLSGICGGWRGNGTRPVPRKMVNVGLAALGAWAVYRRVTALPR